MKKISGSLKSLINLLNDTEFHSGASLGEQLGISRNAVWKYINQLITLGIQIESAQSVGYRLKHPLVLLDEKEIKKYIHEPNDLHLTQFVILGSISSTNDYFNDQIGSDKLRVCLAEHQSAGRGRFARHWYSPFASNIYLSCAWSMPSDVSSLGGLSLALSLAVVSALKEYGLHELSVKWPNDVLWKGKKLSGNLLEINAESHGNTQVIIGIGLNVNMPENASDTIDRPWASLNQIFGTTQDRNHIAGLLISHLLNHLDLFIHKGFHAFSSKWREADFLLGKKIKLNTHQKQLSGTVTGVDEQGRLLLMHDDDQIIHSHTAGETSIAK